MRLADVNGDGAMDVVSSTEGETRTLFVHWAPKTKDRYVDEAAWKTEALPASLDLARWMFALPMQIDGRHGVDFVAGAKDAGHALSADWKEWRIGPAGEYEAVFLTVADLDRDWLDDMLIAVRGGPLRYHRRTKFSPAAWETHAIELPPNTGTGKSVAVGDIDLDGKPDIVFSCENAFDGKAGVMWMSYRKAATDAPWDGHPISGPQGVKFGLVKLLDLDGDGGLDVLTCEERDNLGVIWYENPLR